MISWTLHRVIKQTKVTLRSKAFLVSAVAASMAAGVAAFLYTIEVFYGMEFLKATVPDDTVFSVCMMFASLVAAFRTSHALTRYTDAAAYLHRLNACWFDTASTLMAFCRAGQAADAEIKRFQLTVVRLVSLMSALSLNSLMGKTKFDNEAFSDFPLLHVDGLCDDTLAVLAESDAKVECIFQMLQQMVVDGMGTGVMSIAPPILTRVFQDLAQGLQTYHEAKKLSEVPLPFAYMLVTILILLFVTAYVPCMMVIYVKGLLSAITFTWGTVFLLWYLNTVAESLSNPFAKESATLDATHIQAHMPMPTVKDIRLEAVMGLTDIEDGDSSDRRGFEQDENMCRLPSAALQRFRAGGWEELPHAPSLKGLQSSASMKIAQDDEVRARRLSASAPFRRLRSGQDAKEAAAGPGGVGDEGDADDRVIEDRGETLTLGRSRGDRPALRLSLAQAKPVSPGRSASGSALRAVVVGDGDAVAAEGDPGGRTDGAREPLEGDGRGRAKDTVLLGSRDASGTHAVLI